VAWWEVCLPSICHRNRNSSTLTRHSAIPIKDVVPWRTAIIVHVRCSLWGWCGCTEKAQSVLLRVHYVSPSIGLLWHKFANLLSIFFWELFPEWIFPLLTGFSIICLAAPNNAAVSRVFGGSNGNEGLGLLSICFDWQVSVNPNFDAARPTNLVCNSILLVVWILWLSLSKHWYGFSYFLRVESLTYYLEQFSNFLGYILCM